MDCFVASAPRNDGYESAISPHDCARFAFESRPSELSEGVGDAGRTDAPQPRVRSGSKRMHTSIHSGSTRNHPASPHAMVLRLIRDLPGEPCTVATVALGFKVLSDPVEPNEPPQDLTPAWGRQDHTISPYANSLLPKSTARLAAPKPWRRRREKQRRHPACLVSLTESNPPCDPSLRLTLPRPPHLIPRP